MYMQRFSYLPAILMFQKNNPGTLGSKFSSAELTRGYLRKPSDANTVPAHGQ